ncbi:hypothetical protein GSI_04279 [Ganoderma sinense ZZ0214-1]|uniref:SH3 domain-containing protein n=1 Tax=Ganoderma sinense ZZ0214-1 TaxID=1077348 RepID=A0A2G8SIR5_9APHY|nr:hypothetical protein GSI_04279 [Ganoderma sinense ZZ0214-1]
MRGDALHNRTGGEYDIVVWVARGKGTPFQSLTIPGPVTCFTNTTERNEFYARAAAELGFAAEWDHNLEYRHLQGDKDIAQWHAIQKKVVEHCLGSTDTSMLPYMGTVASARDLVAMADAFDGPGSPINFWGIGHGSLIGSYLLKMFPERAGRVILDNPVDPVIYSGEDPYRTWRKDIQWANTTLARFAKDCIEDHQTGCRLAYQRDPDDAESDWTVQSVNLAIAFAQTAFGGWKQQLTVELGNHEYYSLLDAIYRHDGLGDSPETKHFAFLNQLNRELDYLTLDLMPTFCGDLDLEHDSETMLVRGRKMPGDLIMSKADAPILARTAFPSLHYMCHLWPLRAVERYSDLTASESEHKRPANPVLILANDLNPLSHPQYAHSVLRSLRGPDDKYHDDADIVLQAQFGVSNFAHGRCMSDVISHYLRNGTMPARHRCYGNGIHDSWRVPEPQTKPTPFPISARQQAQLYPPILSCMRDNKPFPSGWTTSDGRPVLFYVKAMFPYLATKSEDLELLEDDIVGVTALREDGWVIGEPVDATRRQPGKFLLPSNFVCLL